MSTDFYDFWHINTEYDYNMTYVLPTVPNVCSYTTLVKTNCQIFTCLSTDTDFISTKLFFSIPTLLAYVNAHVRQSWYFLLTLSSFVSASDNDIIIF